MGALKIWDGTSWVPTTTGVMAAPRQRGYIESTATQSLAVGTTVVTFASHGANDVAEGMAIASNGFTINESGWYNVRFSPSFSTASANTYALSTNIWVNSAVKQVSTSSTCVWSGYLNSGDSVTFQIYTGTATTAAIGTSASITIDRNGTTWAGMGPSNSVVCTSATRPTLPSTGLEIFETDTLNKMIWTGTKWQFVSGDDTGWIEPTYVNSWAAYPGGATYELPGYRRRNGVVFLKGLLAPPATPNVNMFILPAGFRPGGTGAHLFTCNTNPITGPASTGTAHTHQESSTSARIQIGGSTGAVWPGITGYTGHLSISGISFIAEQ